MQSVLITGAGGFLGKHFVDWFAKRPTQWSMDLVDDLSSDGSSEPEHPTFWHMSLQDFLADTDELTYDLIVHLAAPVGGREKIEQDPLYNAGSLELDSLLFRWAISHAKRVIYPSSSAVYGALFQATATSRPLHETLLDLDAIAAIPMPDEMYGFTKLAGEVLAWKAARYGLSTLCIRPFSGYGEGQSFDYPLPAIAARVARREDPLIIWGSGDQQRDLIHVSDLVNLTMIANQADRKGSWAINLGSGYGTSMRTIAAILAELEGYYPSILNDPTKPEGVFRRIADVDRMHMYAGSLEVGVEAGLLRVLKDVKLRTAN